MLWKVWRLVIMLTMVAEQADWVQKIHGKSLDENLDKDAEMSKVRVESGKYFVKIACSIKLLSVYMEGYLH